MHAVGLVLTAVTLPRCVSRAAARVAGCGSGSGMHAPSEAQDAGRDLVVARDERRHSATHVTDRATGCVNGEDSAPAARVDGEGSAADPGASPSRTAPPCHPAALVHAREDYHRTEHNAPTVSQRLAALSLGLA